MFKRFSAIILLSVITVFGAFAQTKQFKKEWKKLLDPIYFQSDGETKGIPNGYATMGIYGFNEGVDYSADASFTGHVSNGVKVDRTVNIVINDGEFALEQGDINIGYTGDYDLSISPIKAEKITKITISLTGGVLKYEGNDYKIKKRLSKDIGTIEISVTDKNKGKPMLDISTDHLYLPVTEITSPGVPANFYSDLMAGNIHLTEADSLFIYTLLGPTFSIKALPDYKERHTILRVDDKVVDDELNEILIGNTLELNGITAKRNGNAVTATASGAPHTSNFTAVYRFTDNGTTELLNVDWEEMPDNSFDRGTLKRKDGSKFKKISFDPAKLAHTRGNVLEYIRVLEDLTDPDCYELDEYADREGLKVMTYVTADDISEPLVDNKVASLVKRAQDIKNEEIQWGPYAYMSIHKVEMGNNKGNDTAYSDVLYASDVRYLSPKAVITPHAMIDRNAKLLVKLFNPAGNLIKDFESTDNFTYQTDVTITPGMTSLSLGAWGNNERSIFEPGIYRIEVWHADSLLHDDQFTLVKKPETASIATHRVEQNAYEGDVPGVKIFANITADAMKDRKLKLTAKFFKADGKTPASINGKPMSCEVTLPVTSDSEQINDAALFVATDLLIKALGTESGKLKFILELRDDKGRQLDSVKNLELTVE